MPESNVSQALPTRKVGIIVVTLAAAASATFWTFRRPHSPPNSPPLAASSALDDEVVARIGGRWISTRELLEAYQKRGSTSDPDGVLESLIRRELLFSEAERTGFLERDEVRAAWRSWVATRFREHLTSSMDTPKSVLDEAIAQHYRDHLHKYCLPEKRRIAVLQVAVPPRATPERRAQIEDQIRSVRAQAVEKAAASPNFGELSLRHSTHVASRGAGGEVGWLTLAQARRAWPNEVAEAAFSLAAPGEISEPLPTDEGWFLLKLIESETPQPPPLASVQERIRYELEREEVATREARYFEELRRQQGVEVNSQLLDRLLPRAATLAHQPPSSPTP